MANILHDTVNWFSLLAYQTPTTMTSLSLRDTPLIGLIITWTLYLPQGCQNVEVFTKNYKTGLGQNNRPNSVFQNYNKITRKALEAKLDWPWINRPSIFASLFSSPSFPVLSCAFPLPHSSWKIWTRICLSWSIEPRVFNAQTLSFHPRILMSTLSRQP